MYNYIIVQKEQRNAAKEKWYKGEEGITIESSEEWSAACSRAYTSTRETKLHSFQFKLLHRIVPCGSYLKRIRINTSDQCTICNQKDSIPHFFHGCETVRAFWTKVGEWLNQVENIQLEQLTPKEYLFGVPKELHQSSITNRILLYARYYI